VSTPSGGYKWSSGDFSLEWLVKADAITFTMASRATGLGCLPPPLSTRWDCSSSLGWL